MRKIGKTTPNFKNGKMSTHKKILQKLPKISKNVSIAKNGQNCQKILEIAKKKTSIAKNAQNWQNHPKFRLLELAKCPKLAKMYKIPKTAKNVQMYQAILAKYQTISAKYQAISAKYQAIPANYQAIHRHIDTILENLCNPH